MITSHSINRVFRQQLPIADRRSSEFAAASAAADARIRKWSAFYEELDEVVRSSDKIFVSQRAPTFVLMEPTESGFPIAVGMDDEARPMLSMGAWFDEYDCSAPVLEIIRRALDGRIRTKTVKLGTKLKSCSLETRRNGDDDWLSFACVGYVRWSLFSRKEHIHYRCFDS
jgi:hypothetical protein